MRAIRRFGIIFSILAIGFAGPIVVPAMAATGCVPGTGEIALFEGPNYSGNCSIKGTGSYDTAAMGVGDNTIESIKIGPAGTWHRRLLACQGPGFTGACSGFKASGNLPWSSFEPEANFKNTVSSFRVQRYDTSQNFAPPQCTWGAAKQLYDYAGIYPGWSGHAKDWNNNASDAGYLVNDTPVGSSIVNMEAGNVRTVAKGWSGAINGGSPVNTISNWPDNVTYGHVAWVVDVRTTSSGVKWIHTVESNVNVSPSGWETFVEGGVTFFHIYTRWNSTDNDTMAIIHITG